MLIGMVWSGMVWYDVVQILEYQICSEWYGMMSFVKDKKTVVAPIQLAAVTPEHSPHIGLDTVI